MNVPYLFASISGKSGQSELDFIWSQARPEAKIIIVFLAIFSIIAWSVMISKALQMRRAKRLNQFFNTEYRTQKHVLDVYDRRVQAEDCPMFMVYQAGSVELDTRLKNPDGTGRKRFVSLKGMEHVKRSLENTVAQESLKLESGLILLAIAVSGAPFLGLLGTVWGVMSTFAHIAQEGEVETEMAEYGILYTPACEKVAKHRGSKRKPLVR
jgi:biopolymer transport protein ExbB/TolQ